MLLQPAEQDPEASPRTPQAVMRQLKDPDYTCVEDYLVFYKNQMEHVSQQRTRYLERTDAKQVTEANRRFNRYNFVAIIESQPF